MPSLTVFDRARSARNVPFSAMMIVLAFGLYALIAAALFAINTPPYQNADETNHFLRADNASRGHLMGRRLADGQDVGGLAAPEIARSGAAFDWPKFHPERKVTVSEYDRAAAKFAMPAAEITFPNTAIYPPTLYAPSIVAIWIGKLTRSSVVQSLYLARLLTGLVSGLAIVTALYLCVVRGADGAACGIFVVATLPMALSLQSSVSQDGPMLGVAALAAALLVRLRQEASVAALAGLCACAGVLAMGRPPYVLLALLPLAARGRLAARLAATAIAAAACLAWSAAVSAGIGTVSAAANKADLSAQVGILAHPGRVAMLLINTLRASGWEYAEQLIGRLGWLDVSLPAWYIQFALIGLAICFVVIARPFDRSGAVVIAAVIAAAIAVMMLIYFSWTGVGRPVIEGVQGRYFLPLVMVLCGLGASLPRSRLLLPLRFALLLWPLISIGVTMRALVLRYYLAD